jgi:hypothetical protein
MFGSKDVINGFESRQGGVALRHPPLVTTMSEADEFQGALWRP